MLLQQSPFRGEDEDEIYDAILADEPLYPIHMPRDSVSILQKLLTREPDQRLGSGPTDAQEIMSQPFFRNINWDDVYHKRLPSPYLPQITSATDTSNFDSEFTVSLLNSLCRPWKIANVITERDTCSDASAKRVVSSYARRVPRLFVLCRLRLNVLFPWLIAKTDETLLSAVWSILRYSPVVLCWVFGGFSDDYSIGWLVGLKLGCKVQRRT